MVYGYTRICTNPGPDGRLSVTALFPSMKERNEIMYEDYAETFDVMEAEGAFAGQDPRTDVRENEKMGKDEFIEQLLDSDDMEHGVFGLIEAYDYYIQFEPFCKAGFRE